MKNKKRLFNLMAWFVAALLLALSEAFIELVFVDVDPVLGLEITIQLHVAVAVTNAVMGLMGCAVMSAINEVRTLPKLFAISGAGFSLVVVAIQHGIFTLFPTGGAPITVLVLIPFVLGAFSFLPAKRYAA